jgi:hypothetical protein
MTPKTAEQINLPQTGKLTVTQNPNVPKPHKLQTPPEPKPKQTEGWWGIKDVSGSLEGVTNAIEKDATIPRHWKDAIKADIALRCGKEFNFVYLDAHFFVDKGNAVLHYHAVPDKKLL